MEVFLSTSKISTISVLIMFFELYKEVLNELKINCYSNSNALILGFIESIKKY